MDSLQRDGESACSRDLAVPAPAQGQPGGLVPLGRGGACARTRGAAADPALDRLLGLPLVPRDGARVVRGPGDGRAYERALRLHQARPRGAPGPRLDLHGGLPGDDRAGRLAPERLPHARAGALLRRHLLPARVANGDAELALRARRRGQRVGQAPRRDPRQRRADRAAPARRRLAGALGAGLRREHARRRGRGAAPELRPRQRRLRPGAQVPACVGARVPAPPRRDRDERAHAARDGLRRDVRPGGRRVFSVFR